MTARYYVACTDAARGGGPRVGATRVDVLVEVSAGSPPERIERAASEALRKPVGRVYVFGTYAADLFGGGS